jgi:hypothetical protein
MSFHEKRFAFTRRTCLAAAKTIINEMKEDAETVFPNIWVCLSRSISFPIPYEFASPREMTSNPFSPLASHVSPLLRNG